MAKMSPMEADSSPVARVKAGSAVCAAPSGQPFSRATGR